MEETIDMIESCECITPFASPVVPEEYGNAITLSSLTFSLNDDASVKFKPKIENDFVKITLNDKRLLSTT